MISEDDKLIPSSEYRAIMGDISPMTEHRWDRDPRIPTPPVIYIRRQKYRRLRDVRQFQATMAAASHVPTMVDPRLSLKALGA